MSFLEKILTNHPLVNILFSIVLIMGALAYVQMPREQDPDINFNWVNINTVLPGASSENVEELITGPLEDAVRTIPDIRFVSSTTRESVSNIIVRFRDLSTREFDKRVNDLRREIQNKANAELPDEAEDPTIIELTSSSGFPTAIVVVTGQADDEQLRRQARAIRLDLERMKGVDSVIASGLQKPEINVLFDPQALASRGLTAIEIADSLSLAFRDVSAGTTEIGRQKWGIQIDGATADMQTLAEFRINSSTPSAGSIRLADVAKVERSREEPSALVSFDGQPAVSLSINKLAVTNTLELVDRINLYIEEKAKVLAGSGIGIELADDQTVQTRSALAVMQLNAVLGLFLVLMVCWLFLGLRIAAMVTLGIAFSIAGTFWILRVTGNTLNTPVLLGIVIVLGMLVDDAVVVVEAIYYRLTRGAEKITAAIAGLQEVAIPVGSAVATTMAAFLPLMLLTGIIGKWMFIIPFVVTMGLMVSLVEAFWILPAHVIGISKQAVTHDLRHWRSRWTHALRIKYVKALCWAVRRPKRLLIGIGMAFIMAMFAVLGPWNWVKIDFFRGDPIRVFYVNVDMPADSPIEETLKQTVFVEERTRKYLLPGEARAITSMAGIKFTEVEPLYGDQYGQIQVSLNPATRGSRGVDEIIDSMRANLQSVIGDGKISLLGLSGGPPAGKPISVKVRADDFVELRQATDALKEIVDGIDGTYDIVDNDTAGNPELRIGFQHSNITYLGLSPGAVSRLTRLHADGEIVAFIRDLGEKVELRVRGRHRNLEQVDDLLVDPIALPTGSTTQLGELVTSEKGTSRSQIRHYNFRRSITVEAEIDDDVINTVEANDQIVDRWNEVRSRFPNTSLDFSGELDDIQESLDSMLTLFIMGVGLMYLILATQFRSYFQPFLILVTVPMAFTGVVAGLLVTQNPLSLFTMYGIIALTGIAVNGAIVLIDAANKRIESGMRPLHATVYAARRRVIPIIMTTTTTIAGLFSLAVGLGGKSLLWGPVASSMVAGLTVATPLTLFVIPVLYRVFMRGHYRPDAVGNKKLKEFSG